MPLELSMRGAQPLVIETGEGDASITWRILIPYGASRKLRAAAVSDQSVSDSGDIRVRSDLAQVERLLLFDEGISVSWEGVTLNGKPVPYNSQLVEDGEIPSEHLAQLCLRVVNALLAGGGAPKPTSSGSVPPNGSEGPSPDTLTTP